MDEITVKYQKGKGTFIHNAIFLIAFVLATFAYVYCELNPDGLKVTLAKLRVIYIFVIGIIFCIFFLSRKESSRKPKHSGWVLSNGKLKSLDGEVSFDLENTKIYWVRDVPLKWKNFKLGPLANKALIKWYLGGLLAPTLALIDNKNAMLFNVLFDYYPNGNDLMTKLVDMVNKDNVWPDFYFQLDGINRSYPI